MYRYYVLFIICALFSSENYAQKILLKEWDASAIETIVINSDEVFNINISKSKKTA